MPPPPISAEDQTQLVNWLKAAGRLALEQFRRLESVEIKADDTFVTAADLAIEQFLTEKLRAAYPTYGLISEEGAEAAPPAAPYTWVLDPLDGTTVFSQGLPGWGIALGLLDAQNRPCLGYFYMPLQDDLSWARRGDPAGPPNLTQAAGSSVSPNKVVVQSGLKRFWPLKGALALSSGSSLRYFEFDLPRIYTPGSAGASLIYTARGSVVGAFIRRAYLWDLVAGGMILEQAGGVLRYLSGGPVDLAVLRDGRPIPEPILAAHPDLLDELAQAIRPR